MESAKIPRIVCYGIRKFSVTLNTYRLEKKYLIEYRQELNNNDIVIL